MEPILLPVPDACRVIGVSRSVLYELIAEGAITTRKLGRKTLILLLSSKPESERHNKPIWRAVWQRSIMRPFRHLILSLV
jgi:excisionase family DNA binding protein